MIDPVMTKRLPLDYLQTTVMEEAVEALADTGRFASVASKADAEELCDLLNNTTAHGRTNLRIEPLTSGGITAYAIAGDPLQT